MKRRKFLEIAALTPLAATVLPPIAHAQIPPSRPSRGGFPPRDPGPATYEPTGPGIQVRFLGTGAADWNGPSAGGELRRHASILADGKVLFDYTPSAADMVPAGLHPEVIFYTHSHSDHYHPKSALELGVRRVYLGETWLERGTRDFERAAEETGRPMPEIIPLRLGQAVEQDGLTVTPLPANHQSNHVTEETDTGGLTARATGYAGIGQFTRERKFLTGIIMEATMPLDYKLDFRLFSHSSVGLVADTVKVLADNRKYIPVEGQKVYLTHLSKMLQPPQDELDRTLPDPLRAAYDGLEVLFR